MADSLPPIVHTAFVIHKLGRGVEFARFISRMQTGRARRPSSNQTGPNLGSSPPEYTTVCRRLQSIQYTPTVAI